MLQEVPNTRDNRFIDASDGSKALRGHRDNAFLLDERKNGFHSNWIHAEVLLGQNLLFLKGPGQMTTEELAIASNHIEFLGVEGLNDKGVIQSRKVIPKKESSVILFFNIVYHGDFRIEFSNLKINHHHFVKPIEKRIWLSILPATQLLLESFFFLHSSTPGLILLYRKTNLFSLEKCISPMKCGGEVTKIRQYQFDYFYVLKNFAE